MGFLFTKVGFFSPPSLLGASIIDLFFGAGRAAGLWLDLVFALDLEFLLTDSFMHLAASINLEKEVKDRFSKNILYCFSILWRQTLTSTSYSIGLQQSKAFS